MSHLLPLSALHTAAPGILDVVFGPDGDAYGDRTPYFRGPLWHRWWGHWTWLDVGPAETHGHRQPENPVWRDMRWLLRELDHGNAGLSVGAPIDLDLRIPSVAARLAGLCATTLTRDELGEIDLCWEIMAQAMSGSIRSDTAALLAVLILAVAPRIAALGGTNG